MGEINEMAAELGNLYPNEWAFWLIRLHGPSSECGTPGKQPCEVGWNKLASKRSHTHPMLVESRRAAHLEAIARWALWSGNVGLAIPPGVVVFDVDDSPVEAVAELLPDECPKQWTGNGAHIVAREPDGYEIRGTSVGAHYGRWAVTLRCFGNQVVVQPSVHANGTSYEWERELPATPGALPELEPKQLTYMYGTGGNPYAQEGETVDAPVGFAAALLDPGYVFAAGQRHNAMLHAASHMSASGIHGQELWELCQEFAEHRLEGGLPDRELREIVRWFVSREESDEQAG